MADVSVVIKSKTADEKTSTTTITNVNPDATNAQLYELGYKIHSFTYTGNPIITKQTSEVLLAGGE